MKRKILLHKIPVIFLGLLFLTLISCGDKVESKDAKTNGSNEETQKEETFIVEKTNGQIKVHNQAAVWGDSPELRLELLYVLGGSKSQKQDLSLYKPTDIALDKQGFLYILDSGNHIIRKLDPDGTQIASFGREGQGPGEFQFMEGIAVDDNNNIYVSDKGSDSVKIISPEGNEVMSFRPGRHPEKFELFRSGNLAFANTLRTSDSLITEFDQKGNLVGEYGKAELHEDFDRNRYFNRVFFAKDRNDNFFIAYATRNKIEKYSPTGDLILSIDRPLNYQISQEIVYEEKPFGKRRIKIPFVNFVSASIAVDENERIWVLSYDRQLKFEEMGFTMQFRDGDGNYEGSESLKSADEERIDAFVFHVFNEHGHFLGKIPLTHHGGLIRIFQDKIYILESRHNMCVYVYKILGI